MKKFLASAAIAATILPSLAFASNPYPNGAPITSTFYVNLCQYSVNYWGTTVTTFIGKHLNGNPSQPLLCSFPTIANYKMPVPTYYLCAGTAVIKDVNGDRSESDFYTGNCGA